MTFKQNWEKTDQYYSLSPQVVMDMVTCAFPQEKLMSHQVIAGGCANLNIKIILENRNQPYILRIYLRDKDAAYREQELGKRLQGIIPIPQIDFIGSVGEYRFAISSFISGITLRDLLLGEMPFDMEKMMEEVGDVLAKIQTICFPSSGFFAKDLSLQEPITENGYEDFAKECLNHPIVINTLGQGIVLKIDTILEKYAAYFPNEMDNHLVHGDFDPSNILVDWFEDGWKISGVLDWEFAFAGSPLQDIANMLRYAHHMPITYEQSFLKGLQKGGFVLPEDWRLRIDLLNLVALLDPPDCLDPSQRPNRCADIRELVDHILSRVRVAPNDLR